MWSTFYHFVGPVLVVGWSDSRTEMEEARVHRHVKTFLDQSVEWLFQFRHSSPDIFEEVIEISVKQTSSSGTGEVSGFRKFKFHPCRWLMLYNLL